MILATATCTAFASTAAANDSEPRSVTVHFSDLDISRPHDVEALKHRIHRAAVLVCGDPGALELRRSTLFNNCVSQATDTALAKVNSHAR
jgi:UrcA family protein